jgi:N-acetylmuramoyl-L-alanine amidase
MNSKAMPISFIVLLCISINFFWSDLTQGITSKQAYFEAESCYKKLRSSSQKMKYRENWLSCIEKFQEVYRIDPANSWAPAGLYMSGKLFRQLAKRSGKKSDWLEARDIFERVIKRYPDSRYRDKAAAEIRTLSFSDASQRESSQSKSSNSSDLSTDEEYRQAESCYSNLKQNPEKMKYRHNWMRCIDRFYASYRKNPNGEQAAAALFKTGKLYSDLYQSSRRQSDLRAAHTMYERVIDRFPYSRYKVKASLLIDAMPQWVKRQSPSSKKRTAKKIDTGKPTPTGPMPTPSPKSSSPRGVLGTVENLRFWSNPNYTRIVIDASQETSYYHHLLKKDPAIKKPQRLYVDLKKSRLGENIKKVVPINDDLLIDARAGQYTSDSVRVVVDIKSFKTYKIFSLKDPFRIVIDVWGTVNGKKSSPQQPAVTNKKMDKLPSGALAKQLALGVSRIVIDPGHGGRDYGAPGYLKGVHEKNVVLQISKRLAKLIRKELKCEVFLTRNSDKFLTLEERTAIANTKNADLFISIHTNSNRDRRAYGIETYFLNLATDDEAIRVAAMENATSTKNISDLQTILYDLMQNAKINESSRLAGFVQSSTIHHLRGKRYSRIKDKGVKQAPFYVLIGAQMPAILVETSFISNPRECKRLVNPQYQQRLCEAIVAGIKRYIRETAPTAHFKARPNLNIEG